MNQVQAELKLAWPDKAATIKRSRPQQLSFGAAWFRGFSICDENLNERLEDPKADLPIAQFAEGETAHLFFEFVVEQSLRTPFPGFEITDGTGRVVHSKVAPQAGHKPPVTVEAGALLRYHQSVRLDLPPGTYAISLSFFSRGAPDAPIEGIEPPKRQPETSVRNVTGLRITRSQPANYAGIANLVGSIEADIKKKGALDVIDGLRHRKLSRRTADPSAPAVFHITHHKAGSTWISRILHEAVPELVVPAVVRNYQVLQWPIKPGAVYPQTYLDKRTFDSLSLPSNFRTFVVIRDLRDALISAYFSFKKSHRVIDPGMMSNRQKLESESFEAGLQRLMDTAVHRFAAIQLSWLEAGAKVLKYEDLLANDVSLLTETLIGHCALPISEEKLKAIIEQHRFEKMTKGRKPGEEDSSHHLRKGISGDWRNHFTPAISETFKNRFGSVLIATGYEKDLDW